MAPLAVTVTRGPHCHLARQQSAQRRGYLKCQGVSCWKTLRPAPLTLLSSQAVINHLQPHQPEITTVDWTCSFQSFNHLNFLWITSSRMFIIRIFLCYKDSWKHFFFFLMQSISMCGLNLGLLKNFPTVCGGIWISYFYFCNRGLSEIKHLWLLLPTPLPICGCVRKPAQNYLSAAF